MTTLLEPLRDSEDAEHVRRHKGDERKLKKKEKKKSRGGDGDGEEKTMKEKKKKRKNFDADGGGGDIAAPAARGVGAAPSLSQPPKKKKKRPPKKSAAAFAASLEAAATIATASAEEQAAWLWSSAEETLRLSAAELAGLDASKVLPLPSPSSSPGSSATLDERLAAADPELSAELTRWSPPTSSAPSFASSSKSASAAPLLLALSPSANNCLACISSLPRTSANSLVAKLFARHFKVGEQEALLRANAGRVRAAAGTPARVDALATSSASSTGGGEDSKPPPALDLSKLRLLVLDVAPDAKQRTLLDIPETKGDAWGLFGRHLMERVRSGECKVALFDSGAKGKLTATSVGSKFHGRGGGRGGGGFGGRDGRGGFKGFGGGRGRGGGGGRGGRF